MQVRVEALEDFLNHKKGDTFGVDEGVAKAWAGAGFVSILGDQPEIKTPDSTSRPRFRSATKTRANKTAATLPRRVREL